MPRTIEYKDPERMGLVKNLRKHSRENSAPIWATVANELERVRKNRREVNLGEINQHTSEGDVVIVPGKVIGSGSLDHRVTVAAFKFSEGAKNKIEKIGESMSIQELSERNPKGSGVKIMG
ncbi:MAG: 50S ribosomal protein L18e [Candidatus Altiarchaeales archaeon WOR_SM1_86-2]|nr:MAG: 50S ribosomal protein L18e [Candidatus Altiarchaeales archaeon WOR_SM1_86-2]